MRGDIDFNTHLLCKRYFNSRLYTRGDVSHSIVLPVVEDIYEFSIIFEDMLVDDYYEMYEEQPEAMELLASNVPYICAKAEPGMKPAEIEAFKSQLEKEYQKAKQAMR